MDVITAGCMCGEVRLQARGEPDRVGICHCMDCRKHHGAVFYAAAIFDESQVTVEGTTHHYQQRHRQLLAKAFVSVARAFMLAAPFHHVAGRDVHRLDGFLHLGKYGGRSHVRRDVGANSERRQSVPAMHQRVFHLDIDAIRWLEDDTYDPKAAPEMVRMMVSDGLDLVNGTRAAISQTAYLKLLDLMYKSSDRERTLSGRELEAINMIARGKSNPEVAEAMSVSGNTINTLLKRIFEKLDVSDRVSAVMRAYALGYIA